MPSSSTQISASAPRSSAPRVMWPIPSLACSPCRTAFSTSGWLARTGTATGRTPGGGRPRDRPRRHLGGDPEPALQPVAEPGLLQHQVALDVAQLVGEGGELAA